jgi:predicted transposase YbfD/YdcC
MVSAWAAANELVRGQVKVDDKSNWVLDIAFPEDECRVRKDHGPRNLVILRHIAANLLKQEKTAKAGISNKRLRAGWDEEYLRTALAGLFH